MLKLSLEIENFKEILLGMDIPTNWLINTSLINEQVVCKKILSLLQVLKTTLYCFTVYGQNFSFR